MADFRAPLYSYVHAARTVGADAITVSDTAHADFPKDNLIDDRNGTRFMWSGSVASPTIDIDLGSPFESGISRLIIPANHNIQNLYVQDDSTAAFSSPADLHASPGVPDSSPSPGTLYDSGLFDTANSTQQFIRIGIVNTAQYYLSQICLTKSFQPDSSGIALADSLDSKRANATRLNQPTGLSPTVQNGPLQRVIEYKYESPLTGGDLSVMEVFVASVGMTYPFFVDPASFSDPPEAEEPVLWMKFAEMPEARNSILVPMNGVRSKTYHFQLIESLD